MNIPIVATIMHYCWSENTRVNDLARYLPNCGQGATVFIGELNHLAPFFLRPPPRRTRTEETKSGIAGCVGAAGPLVVLGLSPYHARSRSRSQRLAQVPIAHLSAGHARRSARGTALSTGALHIPMAWLAIIRTSQQRSAAP